MKYTALALAAFFSFAPITEAAFETNLRYGMTGPAVSELQDLLVYEGCLGVPSTGFFGVLTLQGVKCLQSKYGIVPVSGFFGVLSRTQANAVLEAQLASSTEAELEEVGEVEEVPLLGGFDTPSVEPVPETATREQKYRLAIIGNDNAFQVSLDNYGPSEMTLEVSAPASLKEAGTVNRCDGNYPCNIFKNYVRADSDKPTDLENGDYTFTVSAGGKSKTVTVGKGEVVTL
jgi:peptidoglycan hydrolase-like protein with peptidoglycan-binding domain